MKLGVMVYLDGLIAGIIGAAVIAIWFLFLDTVSGLPFYAPTVLGTGIDWKESQSWLFLTAFCDSRIWVCRHNVRFC